MPRARPDPRNGISPLLRAKLQPPNLEPGGLERPRLIEALVRHAGRPLTLISADAGWGKTTIAAAFARASHRPVVWYSLMSSDSDLRVFGRYLLEGFRSDVPRFGRDFARVLEDSRPGGSGAEMLGEVFVHGLSELTGPPRLLVLEDLHAVSHQPAVITFLDSVLRSLPPSTRMLVTTRTSPPLALERMRVRGELHELDAADLRYSRDEIGTLFERRIGRPCSESERERLESASSGWPTAVQLVLEALQRDSARDLEDVLADLRVPEQQLRAFFSAEVFRRLEPEMRELIERTIVVQRLDASLAEALSGRRDAPRLLATMARRGLLRSFGSGVETTYEWLDLVRSFVRREIEDRAGPEAWAACEARAVHALRARGEHERALGHALRAGDHATAAELLVEAVPAMLREGRAAAAFDHLSELPPAMVDANLTLMLAQAESLVALGRWDDAERGLQAVLAKSRAQMRRVEEYRALLGLGKVLNLRGRHEEVLGMAERGLAIGETLPMETRVRLMQMKASAHFYLGQHRAALAILEEVRERLADHPDPELMVPTLHNLAIALASLGRPREASQWLRAALAQVRGTASPRAPLYLSNLAFLLLDTGELAEARRAAEEGLAAARRFSNRAQEATCLEALAEALAQGGDLDSALASLRQAEELHDQLRMDLISADLLAARGRIFCARGQFRRAVGYVSQAVALTAVRPGAPRLTYFRSLLAWCELRAGRPQVSRRLLEELLPAVDQGENDDERMRVHYWLAESLLALGEKRGVEGHLVTALALVRERGYSHFVRQQAKEQPAPLLEALGRDIEVDTCADALAEVGASVEEALVGLAERCGPAAAEAALTVLGESGGGIALARLPAVVRKRRRLASAARSALAHIQAREARRAAVESGGGDQTRLVLFGPPRLEMGGRLLPASAWRAQRAFHLFILLALRPGGASRDELLELFWPGRRAAAASRNFHPTLSYIRSTLPRARVSPLKRSADVYRLDPDYPLACDVWEFEAAIESARRKGSDPARLADLERATALCERPALEGLSGAWAEPFQHRMRDRVEALHLDAGRLRRRLGDQDGALRHFERAAELDEFRETSAVSIIECLIASGNRAAALARYDRLRSRLRRELQVEPLPETIEAVEKLLNGHGKGRGQLVAART